MGFCRVEFWENNPLSDRTSSNSKTDPVMPKTEPISNTGNTYVTTYLRAGKKLCAAAVREGWDNGRKNSWDAKVSEEGEGGSVLGDGAETPLQLMEKVMLEQMSTYGPWRRPWWADCPPEAMEEHIGADKHLQPMDISTLE